jgi:hypothetical protein
MEARGGWEFPTPPEHRIIQSFVVPILHSDSDSCCRSLLRAKILRAS